MPPLHDLRVIDLTRVLAGPYCAMLLGDMGAEVTNVEEPVHGDDTRAWSPFQDGVSTFFLGMNRSKKSVALNLKTSEGAEALRRLIRTADVLIENFRPGSLKKLGFDYETVRAWNPQLVYCSITGYGHQGPQRDLPGYDAVIQGESGLMHVTGAPDGPPTRVGVAITDGSSHKCVHDSAPAGRPRRGKRVRMRSCQLTSGEVVCRSVDGRLRGPRF